LAGIDYKLSEKFEVDQRWGPVQGWGDDSAKYRLTSNFFVCHKELSIQNSKLIAAQPFTLIRQNPDTSLVTAP
jgi:hypothetical protein